MTDSESDKDSSDLEDSHSSTSQNDNFELCNVCKMEIPEAYLSDHMQSIIHKTNIKITKISLERSKDHLANFKLWKQSTSQPTEEFCDLCNVVYHYLAYSEHVRTEKHRKLIVYQKILPRMCELFKDTANNLHLIDEVDEIFKKYKTKEVKQEAGKTYCEICDVYKNTDGFNGHLRGKKHKKNCTLKNVPVPNIKKVKKVKEEKYCDVCGVFKSANNFDLHLNSKKHQKKARKFEKDDSSVDDKTENEDLLNIKRLTEGHDKYIIDIGSDLKRCTICQSQLVDNDEIIKEHMETTEHLLAYKDFLLNNNITKLVNEYFCAVCNIFISDLIEHVRMTHNKFNRLNIYETYCELCKVKVPSSGKYLHDAGAKHCEKQKIRRRENIKFIDIELDDDIDRKSLTVVDNKLSCTICKTSFDDKIDLVNHFNGIHHKLQINYYARDNHMEIEKETYHCTKCDVVIERKDVLEHVKSSEHKWKV